MADDRHYVGGDNYILDDLSGFKIRASKAKLIPGGQTGNLAVAPERWEPQQPQDLVTGEADDMTVALSRSRQANRFVIVGTFIVAPSAAQSQNITVDSSVGFRAGNVLQIMLDTGVNFFTALAIINGNVWTLASKLPASVGTSLGDPIENSVLQRLNLVIPVPFVLNALGQDILGFNVLG